MGAKHSIEIIFVPQIEHKVEGSQVVKLKGPLFQNTVRLARDMGDQWSNAWTMHLNSKQTMEYQYVVVQPQQNGESVIIEDVVRKIDLSKLHIDGSKKNSIAILTAEDSWGSLEKTKFALTQVPIKQEKACVVLGNYLSPDHSLRPEIVARIEKLDKLIKEDPKRYKFAIMAGNSLKKIDKLETIAMFDYGVKLGIDPQLMVKEKEAKDTLENAIFCKIKLARMGIVEFDIITSKDLQKRPEMIYNEVFGNDVFKFGFIDDEFEVTEELMKKNEYLIKGLDKSFYDYGFLREKILSPIERGVKE